MRLGSFSSETDPIYYISKCCSQMQINGLFLTGNNNILRLTAPMSMKPILYSCFRLEINPSYQRIVPKEKHRKNFPSCIRIPNSKPRPLPLTEARQKLLYYIFCPQCIDSGYLVSATPHTILYRFFFFLNLAHVFSMVWRCACGLHIILALIFSTLWTLSFSDLRFYESV